MRSAHDSELTQWFLDHAGPIIRYRTAKELAECGHNEIAKLGNELQLHPEFRRWAEALQPCPCHGTGEAYLFPKSFLPDKKGYYNYSGTFMGLGENRRRKIAMELESTFRVFIIRKNMVLSCAAS